MSAAAPCTAAAAIASRVSAARAPMIGRHARHQTAASAAANSSAGASSRRPSRTGFAPEREAPDAPEELTGSLRLGRLGGRRVGGLVLLLLVLLLLGARRRRGRRGRRRRRG